MDMLSEIASKVNCSPETVERVSEELFKELHRGMVEHVVGNVDYLASRVYFELPERSFYHLLGFLEQFSQRYDWPEGSINEYLGRMPPVDRWEKLSSEIRNWKWPKSS